MAARPPGYDGLAGGARAGGGIGGIFGAIPRPVLIGAGVVLAGLLAYALFAGRGKKEKQEQFPLAYAQEVHVDHVRPLFRYINTSAGQDTLIDLDIDGTFYTPHYIDRYEGKQGKNKRKADISNGPPMDAEGDPQFIPVSNRMKRVPKANPAHLVARNLTPTQAREKMCDIATHPTIYVPAVEVSNAYRGSPIGGEPPVQFGGYNPAGVPTLIINDPYYMQTTSAAETDRVWKEAPKKFTIEQGCVDPWIFGNE